MAVYLGVWLGRDFWEWDVPRWLDVGLVAMSFGIAARFALRAMERRRRPG